MSGAAAAVLGVLVAAAVVAVAWPFVFPPAEAPPPGEEERRRLLLADRRDAAYAALRDLEDDRRLGRVGEDEYDAERDRLRAEAGRALRDLDDLDSAPETTPPGGS